MKKGKNLLLVSGIFDILFALGLFALIILYFFRMDYVSQLTLSVWSIISMLIYVPFSYIQIIHYSVLGFLGLVGLLSLIFGSVSIARVRNDQKRYYHKGGRLIAFVVLETIALAILILLLIRLFPLPTMTILSITTILPTIAIAVLLALIVLLRYISLGMFYSGKKKYIQTTPVA